MANLNIEITDALLIKLLASAMAKKISLEAHLEEVLAEAEEDQEDPQGFTDIDSALNTALERTSSLPVGKDFQLQDLFTDPEWTSIASPRWFGRKFRPAVTAAGLARYMDKTQTNKAIYRRS